MFLYELLFWKKKKKLTCCNIGIKSDKITGALVY